LGLLPATAAGLLLYYALVFAPLQNKARDLDIPLRTAWTNLAANVGRSNVLALDFVYITNQLAQTREDLAALEEAKTKAAQRLELPAEVRTRMSAPFQLFDFQIDRSQKVEALVRLARELKVAIDPVVLVGFPEHTADMFEPSLLWPALHMVDGLLNTALRCGVSAVHALDVPMALTNSPGMIAPIHVQFEFTGTASAATRLIQSLPLRGIDELRAAGVPNPPPQKPVLFIERLIVRKQSPEKPDEVRVLLRAVGFVFRE
jgi:hypothetical protein